MKKTSIVGAALAVALTWATPSRAETIVFDTNGAAGGGQINADLFDWLPGNSLITENAAGTNGTILFQANLGVIVSPDSPNFLNGSNGFYYTAVAGFGVDISTSGADTTFTFDAASSTNFFKIYVTTTPTIALKGADDLAGTCFVCGIEILSGTATADAFSSTFHVASVTGGPLDQFGTDNYPGVSTIDGTGGTKITVLVNSFDQNYFKNLVAGTTTTFSNTSQIDPYNQANPSAMFTNNGTTDANEVGVAAVGPINGLCIGIDPCKIVAQADANSSFTGVSPVPEPATLTLLGFGLLGSAAARRRRKNAAK